ncbi:unnamed protein product [Hyaloperonospora brassicae]|uniref:Uncharacterized protein n=1 Tax=Hyaloperonospora brassicae TaxID=162125 RepID=A0AAV0TIA1_HYABA|nr:unnamed protein product [Hyaloperonospora brassicae]
MIKKELEPIISKTSGRLKARFDAYVEGLPGSQLRPDSQFFDAASKTAHICDLAIAFEAQKTDDPAGGNMRIRHAEKLMKYQRANEFLETMGWRVQVSALIYGALGSVLPSNYKVLTDQLRITKRKANQLNYGFRGDPNFNWTTTSRLYALGSTSSFELISSSIDTPDQHSVGTTTNLPAGAGLTDLMNSDEIVNDAAQVDTVDDEAV